MSSKRADVPAGVPAFTVGRRAKPIPDIEQAIWYARHVARDGGRRVHIRVAGSTEVAASVWPDGKVDAGWGRYVSTTGYPTFHAAE